MVFGTVELVGAPAASAAVAADRHSPGELGEDADVGGGEPGRDPRGIVAIASVLAEEVTDMPHRGQRIVGHIERGDAGSEVSAIDRHHRRGTLQQIECPTGPIGMFAEQTTQLHDGAAGAGGADGGGVGSGPRQLHRGHDDGRTEHTERCCDHLTWHLAEQAATAGEVGRPIGKCNAIGVTGTRVEAQLHVVRMTLGREVHLADHGFEHRTESASEAGRRRDLHAPTP